jgi:ABC-2 type transport system permease protein
MDPATAIILSAIITGVGPLLFDAPLPVNWGNYLLIFAAPAFAMSGISVLIGVVAPNSRVTILYSQLLFIPSILLSGMMFPYDMLPDVAGRVARLFLATQAMNAFKGLAMGGGADFSPWGSVIALLAGGNRIAIMANRNADPTSYISSTTTRTTATSAALGTRSCRPPI